MGSLISEVIYLNQLSEIKESIYPEKDFLIFDNQLLNFEPLKILIKSFQHSYGVVAGEGLKDLSLFPAHISSILEATKKISFQSSSAGASRVIVMGGGSVGDFGGFIASILKRGAPLIHVPTTWLAAIDSSHGGKTALNVGAYKNQVGTFYKADKVFIVKEVLDLNPKLLEKQAWGEAYKMLLISNTQNSEKPLWDILPSLVKEKHRWVEKDPYEKLGDRRVLNLGHTLGHVLEKELNLSHGWAVGQGLHFSLAWSEKRYKIDLSKERQSLQSKISYQKNEDGSYLAKLSKENFLNILVQDKKKKQGGDIGFVFVNSGPKVEMVSQDEILEEAINQNWISL